VPYIGVAWSITTSLLDGMLVHCRVQQKPKREGFHNPHPHPPPFWKASLSFFPMKHHSTIQIGGGE